MGLAGYEIRYLPTFDDPTQIDREVSEEDWRRCVLLIEQVSSWYKPIEPVGLPATVERVRFPAVDFPVLWPLLATNGDPRSTPEANLPYGPFPYGDRIINEIVSEGLKGADGWSAYQRRSEAALASHARQAKLERMRWEKLEASIGVSVLTETWARLSAERPAHTYNHPTSVVLRRVVEDVLARSEVIARAGIDLRPAIDAYLTQEPYDEFQSPIHPIVAENLGLAWWTPELAYRHYDFGAFTYPAFVRRQIDWDVEPSAPSAVRGALPAGARAAIYRG